jgi:hypothetical protein
LKYIKKYSIKYIKKCSAKYSQSFNNVKYEVDNVSVFESQSIRSIGLNDTQCLYAKCLYAECHKAKSS